jgi:hypothetical protein
MAPVYATISQHSLLPERNVPSLVQKTNKPSGFDGMFAKTCATWAGWAEIGDEQNAMDILTMTV